MSVPTMKRVNESADLELQRLFEESAGHKMTGDEFFEQKVSWVYGNLKLAGREVTKEEVRKRLEANR